MQPLTRTRKATGERHPGANADTTERGKLREERGVRDEAVKLRDTPKTNTEQLDEDNRNRRVVGDVDEKRGG